MGSHDADDPRSFAWTDATSTVKRSIVMDDYVYSVAGEGINIAHRSNRSSTIASIPIAS